MTKNRVAFLTVALLLVGTIITVLAEAANWDLRIAAALYGSPGAIGPWPYAKAFPLKALYDYGEYAVILLTAVMAGLYMYTYLARGARSLRNPALMFIVVIALGPGLLVNGVFKPLWGRPRPVDVTAFGGSAVYRPISHPGGYGAGKSFPCGHCAMAVAVCALIGFRRRAPVAAMTGFVLGIMYALAMGFTRMAQGGHFFTDVVWSMILVFIVIVWTYWCLIAATGIQRRKPSS